MGEPMEERKERRDATHTHTHTHTHSAVGKEKGQRKEKLLLYIRMYQVLVPKGVAVGSLFYVLHMYVE